MISAPNEFRIITEGRVADFWDQAIHDSVGGGVWPCLFEGHMIAEQFKLLLVDLAPPEAQAVSRKYGFYDGHNWTGRAIAAVLGISPQRVSEVRLAGEAKIRFAVVSIYVQHRWDEYDPYEWPVWTLGLTCYLKRFLEERGCDLVGDLYERAPWLLAAALDECRALWLELATLLAVPRYTELEPDRALLGPSFGFRD